MRETRRTLTRAILKLAECRRFIGETIAAKSAHASGVASAEATMAAVGAQTLLEIALRDLDDREEAAQ